MWGLTTLKNIWLVFPPENKMFCPVYLKEYYEIVGESRPLSAISPKHADFFTEMHF